MRLVDLRSDTLTRPTPAMRKAMAEAEVGDDVYGEDPTVNRLEALAAERLGFERALFLPSGTMANQVALLLHLPRGGEVLAPEGAHLYEYELGAPALLAGALVRPVPAPGGRPDLKALEEALRRGPFQAPIGLLALENTHNLAGGRVVPLEVQRRVQDLARARGLPTHLDGARLHNAAVFLGVEAREVARGFTTAMVSLSKGLGAPAGILALEEGPKHLRRDHEMARALAEGLFRLGLAVDLGAVETNMVYLEVEDPEGFLQGLRARGVLAGRVGGRVRFVTHRDLMDEDIPLTLERVQDLLHSRPR